MRAILATVLAVVLILIGIWVLWWAGVRIVQGPPPTPTPTFTPAPAPPAPASDVQPFSTDGGTASTSEQASSLLSVEQRSLITGTVCSTVNVTVNGVPMTVEVCSDSGTPSPAGGGEITAAGAGEGTAACVLVAEPGFAADATVAAINLANLYREPALDAAILGAFGAGQTFLVTADKDGVTAVRGCDLVWVRVRLTGGMFGWVLASAIEVGPIVITPIVITPVAPVTLPPICPGGCATPTCVPPCYTPCVQPCVDPCYSPCDGTNSQQWNSQPCTPPCGVYSQ